MPPRVWLITGCSSGLGAALAHEILRQGDQVIATAVELAPLQDLEKAGAATLELDVTSSPELIKSTVEKALQIYGRIDVLLNNAGMALFGAVEEVLYAIF
jgi:NAD(P)-dependent dehydrogenase (short-subunit alcohol dehydrogenase family)